MKNDFGRIPVLTVTKFHDSMFKVRRSDKDVLVISNKYVDELRNLPQEKLSLTEALYEVCSANNPYTYLETNHRLMLIRSIRTWLEIIQHST